MNYFLLMAGFISSLLILGHLLFGIKWYLQPMLDSELRKISMYALQSMYHFVSGFLLLSSMALLLLGFGITYNTDPKLLVYFIGDGIILFAIIQVYYAFKHNMKPSLIPSIQWTLYITVGILCFLGA